MPSEFDMSLNNFTKSLGQTVYTIRAYTPAIQLQPVYTPFVAVPYPPRRRQRSTWRVARQRQFRLNEGSLIFLFQIGRYLFVTVQELSLLSWYLGRLRKFTVTQPAGAESSSRISVDPSVDPLAALPRTFFLPFVRGSPPPVRSFRSHIRRSLPIYRSFICGPPSHSADLTRDVNSGVRPGHVNLFAGDFYNLVGRVLVKSPCMRDEKITASDRGYFKRTRECLRWCSRERCCFQWPLGFKIKVGRDMVDNRTLGIASILIFGWLISFG